MLIAGEVGLATELRISRDVASRSEGGSLGQGRARSTPAGIWAELFLGGGAGGHSGSLVLDGGGPGPAFLWGR